MGGASEPDVFGECSVTCGKGTRTVTSVFKWSNGDESSSNNIEECDTAVDCPGWGEWKNWNKCSADCRPIGDANNPTQSRYRCWTTAAGEDCTNIDEQSQDCNIAECSEPCLWQEWAPWSSCSPLCNEGIKSRSREGTAACTESKREGFNCGNEVPALPDCPSCFNKFDRCASINKELCNDIRYSAQLTQMCAKYCGACDDDNNRKRRSLRFNRLDQQYDLKH